MQAAIKIYDVCADLAERLLTKQVAFAVENPSNSLMWLVPSMAKLVAMQGVGRVDFQACMWGSGRDKWTAMHFSPATLFADMARACDGNHRHESWSRLPDGTFATSLETVYAQPLCDKMCLNLLQHFGISRSAPLPVQRARGSAPPLPPRDDRAAA